MHEVVVVVMVCQSFGKVFAVNLLHHSILEQFTPRPFNAHCYVRRGQEEFRTLRLFADFNSPNFTGPIVHVLEQRTVDETQILKSPRRTEGGMLFQNSFVRMATNSPSTFSSSS